MSLFQSCYVVTHRKSRKDVLVAFPRSPGHTSLSDNPGVPLCLSNRVWLRSVGVGLLFVGEYETPDMGRDLAFEASHCCFVGLALGDLAVVVTPSGAVTHSDLGDRDQVQRRVQFPVTAS